MWVADFGKYNLPPTIFQIYPERYCLAQARSFLPDSRHHDASPELL